VAELARFLIVLRLGHQPLDHRLLLGRGRRAERLVAGIGRGDPGRTVTDQRRADLGLVEQHLALQQLELEAHRAQFLAKQKVGIAERQAIGRIAGLGRRGDMRLNELGLLLGLVEPAAMEALFFFFGHGMFVAAPA
jgi:hypothetical protein